MFHSCLSNIISLEKNSSKGAGRPRNRGFEEAIDGKSKYISCTDADDIAFTTDEMIYSKMASFGYNSILQDNVKVFRDGSLSVYYGELNRRYINIETQHGKTEQYGEMLKKLLHILDEEKKFVASQVPPDADMMTPLR